MLRCKNCKILLPGAYARCPLCQGDLTGEPDPGGNVYPALPARAGERRSVLARIAFGTAAAGAVCIAVNLTLPASGPWCLFVIGGILSFWISFALVVQKRKNLPKTILWQVIILSLLAFLWDRFTGFQGWSLNYVLPILCTAAMAAMAILAKIRNLDIQDYVLYLIIDCVFGILSCSLLAAGRITEPIPSAVCFAATDISLAALLLFQGRAFLAELQRRFHM